MAPQRRPYTGPDRRQHALACLRPPSGQTMTVVGAMAIAGGLLVPLVVAGHLTAQSTVTTFVIVRVAASMLIISAGVMTLVRWRMTGEATLAMTGSAGVLYGTVGVIPALLRLSTTDRFVPYARAVNSLIVIFILGCALAAPAVSAAIRPARLIGMGLLTSLLVDGLIIRYADRPGEPMSGRLSVDLSIAITGLWSALAAVSFIRGRVRRQPRWAWLGLMGIAAAFAEAARAASYSDAREWLLASGCLLATAGAIWCFGAANELLAVLSDQGNSLLSLHHRLSLVSERLDESKARDEERVHDARAALCAVQSAIATMTRYYERLEEESRSGLERAVDTELGRLRHLLDNVAAADLEPFDLATAIRAVVTAQRTHGTRIDIQVGSSFCWVRGRPADTATVVQTLLENARRHAPGSPITVRIARTDGRVTLAVEDHGPGVPVEERERIFTRGGRGQAAADVPGSGLGLFIAARLMHDQLGAIGMHDGVGGGASFVLTFAQPEDVAALLGGRPAGARLEGVSPFPDPARA